MSNELTRGLQELRKKMRDAAAAAVEQASQEALQAAQARVPVKSGRLRASGGSRLVSVTQMGALGSVFYGAPYAPQVHENANGNGYKWLELAANEVPFQEILRAKWEEQQ
mgnify:CR=1 FL=1